MPEQQPATPSSSLLATPDLLESARDRWIDRLIDTSRRNNLLFFRPTLAGSIEIPDGNPALLRLLTGEAVHATALLPDAEDRPGRILSISRKAQENLEEKGLQTLNLALGFATWTAEDGGRDYHAPIFLLPLEFRRAGSEYNTVEVALAGGGGPRVNPVLLHILEQRFGVDIPADALLPETPDSPAGTEDRRLGPEAVFAVYQGRLDDLAARLSDVPDFRTALSAVIGNFAFAKLAMVNDLKAPGVPNDLLRAIAGDEQARARMVACQVDVDPRSLDTHPPESEFCVIEADSSQQSAIEGIALGQSAVIYGPPGTGKSQTITNLIATLVARGHTVLFVAEKRAALEVVQQRLARSQLGYLAIDVHGAEISSRKVMQRVAETLQTLRNSPQPDAEALHRSFTDRRARLNAHDRRLHTPVATTGLTLFAMQGKLLVMPPEVRSEVRWRGADLDKLTPALRPELRDLLAEAAALASLFQRTDSSPWTGIAFSDGAAAQSALDNARRLACDELPALRSAVDALQDALGFAAPRTFAELDALTGFLQTVTERITQYTPESYTTDLTEITRQLERGPSGLKALWLSLTSAPYKAAVAQATALRRGVKAPAAQLLAELRSLSAEAARWRESTQAKSTPRAYPQLSQLVAHAAEARKLALALQTLRGVTWETLPFDQLAAAVEPFAQDQSTPFRLLKLTTLERRLEAAGLGPLLSDLRRRKPAPGLWPDCFDFAWLSSAIDALAIADPEVKGFVGQTHSNFVADFKKLDADRLQLAVARLRREHALRAVKVMNDHPAQEALIKAEAAKSRRHKPLRSLFSEASEVLTAVCPCWMASPLSVSQLIARNARFDYVIFDEASQVLPEDAMPSILRGRHVVVAGDNQQLPPTGFFAAGLDDLDEEPGFADGFESLLDMVSPFIRGFHLNWHYRSRDESLIAFSNHHIYRDRLVTFPGPGGAPAVSHILVAQVPEADGQEDSSSEEVNRVLQLVLDHARDTPGRTLGVITMGIKHAMRLQGALDKALRGRPELAEFFHPDRPERFFIKNLERVQGDERDSILLSIGYGKNRAGDLPLRFGPILSAGGRRRLNVAITRARETMTVVSSFSHHDIDTAKVREGTGLEFLRNFLQFAASGGKLIEANFVTSEPMNDFEADVCAALEARGMKLVPQVGCSQFRIDFGVCHPQEPGRFVMAIEADGATYHSSATARDRDRLRQQMLENLGWTFHRIWSTDWCLHRHEEIERAWDAYQAALAQPAPLRDSQRLPPAPPRNSVTGKGAFQASTPALDSVPGSPGSLTGGPSPLAPTRRDLTAPIPARPNITDYTQRELTALYHWVTSDGQLRTHDEIAEEMFQALPFTRRGPRIEATLRQTILRCESTARL